MAAGNMRQVDWVASPHSTHIYPRHPRHYPPRSVVRSLESTSRAPAMFVLSTLIAPGQAA